jgi:hypothetical protein
MDLLSSQCYTFSLVKSLYFLLPNEFFIPFSSISEIAHLEILFICYE